MFWVSITCYCQFSIVNFQLSICKVCLFVTADALAVNEVVVITVAEVAVLTVDRMEFIIFFCISIAVTDGGDHFLWDRNSGADFTVGAFRQTGFGTGGSYCLLWQIFPFVLSIKFHFADQIHGQQTSVREQEGLA